MVGDRRLAHRFLKAFPGARDLEPSAVDELLAAVGTTVRPKEDLLFRQGEEADACYFILEGLVCIRRVGPAGEPVVLDRVGPGGLVGEMGVLRRAARLADAVVEEDLVALRMDAETWDAFLRRAHPVSLWLYAEVDRRLAGRVLILLDRLARLEAEPALATEPPHPPVPQARGLRRWIRRWRGPA